MATVVVLPPFRKASETQCRLESLCSKFANSLDFPFRRDRAMSAEDGLGRRSPARKGDIHLNTDTKRAAEILVNKRGRKTDPPGLPSVAERPTPTKDHVAVRPHGNSASKTKKVARRSSRMPSKAEKLVCRYCWSDDLAPSFKKRRDARCRACFKKRYASTTKKTKRAGKTKASK